MLIVSSSDDKSGGVIWGFLVFSPPLDLGRKFSWLFEDFSGKFGGLNRDFSIPLFVEV